MGTIRRGVKNAFRNSIRTGSIVLILGISFALALVMILSRQAVQQKINDASAVTGTTITVTPAGFGGFGFGGGNPLTTADISTIEHTKNVVLVAQVVEGSLHNPADSSSGGFGFGRGSSSSTNTTDLTPVPVTGSLSNAFGGGGGGTFVPPIRVVGTNEPLDTTSISVGGTTISSITITSGTDIDGTGSGYQALVGSALAAENDLKVGSTFTAYSKTFTVTGIFTTNSTAANAGIDMPLKTVETLSGVTGPTSVTVTVNTLSNVTSTASALQSRLGTSVATVSVGTPTSTTVLDSYDTIRNVSTYSLVGALIAGAIILLLCMLMIVRERRREIGVLKAFGSSNTGIVATFMTEAMTLTVLGGVFGIILGALLANPVLGVLKNNASNTPSASDIAGPGGAFRTSFGGGSPRLGGFGGFHASSALNDLHAAVGPSLIVYGILAAVGIAIIGSAVPSFLIAKVRPAEVMRSE